MDTLHDYGSRAEIYLSKVYAAKDESNKKFYSLYYEEYVKENTRRGSRHLKNSLKQFKLFIKRDFIAPIDVTKNFCKRFRQYLLDKFTGETPGNYYSRFKWVVNAAHSDGYFQKNPTEKVNSKSNPSTKLKNNLEVDAYLTLLANSFAG